MTDEEYEKMLIQEYRMKKISFWQTLKLMLKKLFNIKS